LCENRVQRKSFTIIRSDRCASGHANGNRTQWSFQAPVLKNGLAIRFSSAVTVVIDIKPGETPNSINVESKGSIPVAVFRTADFDVTQADASTLRLSGAPLKRNTPGKWQIVN